MLQSTYGSEAISDNCRSSLLRFFRGGENFQEFKKGFYTKAHGRLKYIPDEGDVEFVGEITSNASHLAILRNQIGEERVNQIMKIKDPVKSVVFPLVQHKNYAAVRTFF